MSEETRVIDVRGGEDGLIYKINPAFMDVDGETTQPANDDPALGTPEDAIPPPESLERLAVWSQINGTRAACIQAIARNTVGLGYALAPAKGEEEHQGDARDDAIKARDRLEACASRDRRLERPTFTDQMMAVKTDEEEIGNGYLEVSRDRLTGQISGTFHVPGKRVRRLADRTGYLLLPPDGDENRAIRFFNFGEKVEYAKDGSPTKQLASGATTAGGWRRNELIPFKLYTSESRDYGLPRDVALAVEYFGDKAATEANAAFFDSGGTLPTVLFVRGTERKDGNVVNVHLPAETAQRITATIRSKGQQSGRLAIVPLPEGAAVQKEVLGQMSERDFGFVGYRDDVRQRTLSAFRMAPIFIGLVDEGRYSAEIQRSITLEQVFDPEQDRYEERLRETLLRDLGYGHLQLDFKRLAVENDATRRDSVDKMAEVGAVTRREYREAHGFAPMPEAEEGAEPEPGQVPFGWNDELIDGDRPRGAENRVTEGTDQRGLQPGLAGRESRDRGQSAHAERVEGQVRRLAGANGKAGRGGARRALERARSLPDDD